MTSLATKVTAALAVCDSATASDNARGAALETLAESLFGSVPGIDFTSRNSKDAFATQEIDVAVWNDGHGDGLAGFPPVFLVECKSWSSPVGSMEVAWFDTKLRLKGCSFGVLLALNGITGQPHSLTAAHSIVAAALREERNLVVLTRADLLTVSKPADLVNLIKKRTVQNRVSRPF